MTHSDNHSLRGLLLQMGALSEESLMRILRDIHTVYADTTWDVSTLRPEYAHEIAGRGASMAIMIANSTPHQDVLIELTKHNDPDVVIAAAGNRALPIEHRRRLYTESLRNLNPQRLTAVAPGLPLYTEGLRNPNLQLLTAVAPGLPFMERLSAENLGRSGTRRYVDTVSAWILPYMLAPADPSVTPAMTRADVEQLWDDELQTVNGRHIRTQAVMALLAAQPSTTAMVDCFDALLSKFGQGLTNITWSLSKLMAETAMPIDDGFAELCLRVPRSSGSEAAKNATRKGIRADATFTTWQAAVATAEAIPGYSLAMLDRPDLPREAVDPIAKIWAKDRTGAIGGDHLFALADLSIETISTLIPGIELDTLVRFMYGVLERKPQPGDLTKILEALSGGDARTDWTRFFLSKLRDYGLYETVDAPLPDWIDELVDALGERWMLALRQWDTGSGRNARFSPGTYLAERLNRLTTTGGGTQARDVAAVLLCQTDRPLSDTLTVAEAMTSNGHT